MVYFDELEFLISVKFNLSFFSFMVSTFCVLRIFAYPEVVKIFSYIFFRSLMALAFIFISVVYL